jgi:hypothetical protein
MAGFVFSIPAFAGMTKNGEGMTKSGGGVVTETVAKIDKAEITTEHYTRHRTYFGNRLVESLQVMEIPPSRNIEQDAHPLVLRVDMDEFLKAKNGEILETFGDSTCTGLVVEDHYNHRSMLVAGHLPVAHWHEAIGDLTLVPHSTARLDSG